MDMSKHERTTTTTTTDAVVNVDHNGKNNVFTYMCWDQQHMCIVIVYSVYTYVGYVLYSTNCIIELHTTVLSNDNNQTFSAS